MEGRTALPERPGASNISKGTPDAQIEKTNGKPISNSKPAQAKKERAPKIPKPPKGPTPPKAKKEPTAKPSVEDPESMFKVGFLSDVYKERPVGPNCINKFITRCKSIDIFP